jgi:citrate synthase
MSDSTFLSAREAADLLGVRLETLYAYVSRGLLGSEQEEGGARARRYRREDVLALRRRGEAKRQPAKALEAALGGALDWGGPLLESAITAIAGGRLYYRGRDAVELSRQASFEEVVALVWAIPPEELLPLFAAASWPSEMDGWRRRLEKLPPLEAAQALLPILAGHDPAGFDLRPAATVKTGARIAVFLAWVAAGGRKAAGGVAATLTKAWGVPPEARPLLEAALILCVDHELNVSAFTARCIASADAPLYGAVAGGLAALSGSRHGGHTRRVEALLDEIGEPGRARQVLAERLRRGEAIPGFGHPLYPQGDPRSHELLRLAAELFPAAPAAALMDALIAAAEDLLGEKPTVDCGLVLAARLLALPRDSALTLFGLGRAAGWIGHAREQYEKKQLIRPRARYVGEPPLP